jgi:hypothetical protein
MFSVFTVDGKYYGIGTAHYDSTNTRRTEHYDKWLAALYEFTDVQFGRASAKFGRDIEDAKFSASSPLAQEFVDFSNTFGHLFEYQEDGITLTTDSRDKYIHAENQFFQEFLVSKVFNKEQQIAIEKIFQTTYEN